MSQVEELLWKDESGLNENTAGSRTIWATLCSTEEVEVEQGVMRRECDDLRVLKRMNMNCTQDKVKR